MNVEPHESGCPAFDGEAVKDRDDVIGVDVVLDGRREGFSGVFVDDVQDDPAAGLGDGDGPHLGDAARADPVSDRRRRIRLEEPGTCEEHLDRNPCTTVVGAPAP